MKKTGIPSSIVTRDTDTMAAATGNIYKSIVVVSKRARQVSTKMKEELNNKLADFASTVDNLEEIFENREQIEISRFYERMPKPSIVALEEFNESKVMFREPEEDTSSDKA